MLEYTILEYGYTDSLIVKVSEKIAEGWMPLGGISTWESENRTWYAQAMTRTPDQGWTGQLKK